MQPLAYLGASRMAAMAESQTLALAKRVRQLRAQGHNIVSLTLGEPDFDTPLHIRNAGKKAMDDGLTHYPPVAGIPELREAIANKLLTQNKLHYNASQVVVSTGAKQSILNVLMSLVNPGEEVVLAAPYWVSYYPMVRMAEGIPVVIQAEQANQLKITPEQLEQAITPRTRVFIFNSPSNPTGVMYTEAEVRALAQVLEHHPEVFIISDEIYELIAYGVPHVSIASFGSLIERTATINGFSKGFAMTGWRLGYAAAPHWLADLCERFQGQVTSGATTISQWAGVAALTQSLQPSYDMVAAFHKRRDLVCALFAAQLPLTSLIVPQGAFYLYPDISAYFGRRSPQGNIISNADDFASYLLEVGGVAVVPGTAFGTQQHVRLSYAASEVELTEGVHRMQACLAQLS